MCEQMNRIEPATVVDHITPHKGDMVKFWDESNHQGLCKRHHDTKTATEDGGFGRSIKVGNTRTTEIYESIIKIKG